MSSQKSQLSDLSLMGITAGDLLNLLDQKISSLQLSLKSKKLVKLLPFPPARTCWYYKFEGVSSLFVLLLPCYITNLTGMKTFDSFASRM